MADYYPTVNPDVVEKRETESTNVDLQQYIDRYLSLEQEWQDRPKLKTVPDQETLDFWNNNIGNLRLVEEANIMIEAGRLYDELLPIYELGLIPLKYNDELLRLKNFLDK